MKKILMLLVAVMVMVSVWVMPTSAATRAAMTTNEFYTNITVGEDNTIRITETIVVDFQVSRHGIYRYIPYILEFDHMVDGEQVQKRMRAEITDIYVDHTYSVDTEGDHTVIIIGDEDRYVWGQVTYNISYTMKIYDDGIDAADFFYFNLAPYDWEGEIEQFSSTIRFEKALPESADINFYCGEYGSVSSEDCSWVLNNARDTIQIDVIGNLGDATVTADILLPEGYFSGESSTAWAVPVAIAVAVVVLGLVILLFYLFGRDDPIVPVVNFYPPEKLTSAEIGHIVDGVTDQKDMISLIIYWAHKGYIQIHQMDDDFEFVKLRDLDRTAKSFEAVMFNGLFASGDRVNTAMLKNKFYTTMNLATADINRYFTAIPENKVYSGRSKVARFFGWLLSGLPLALVALATLFASAANNETMLIGAAACYIGSAVICGVGISLWDRRHTKSPAAFKSGVVALGALAVVLAFIAIVCTASLGGMWMPMFIGAAATLVAILFAVPTIKRTKESTRLLGEILGFRQFIEHAELDRLKALVEDDPQYFYNVIPFAYVLGLSDKWAKKFESIAIEPPTWYYGYDYPFSSWLFWSSFSNSMDRCRANMVSVPQQSKGGSFGGFGGGGGFAGGGFGGGGGGSW